jgi:hypothetical protein
LLRKAADVAEPQGTITRINGTPVEFTLGDTTYMMIPDKTKAIVRSALLAYKVDEESLELYKSVGLEPRDFGYADKTWEAWKEINSGPVKNGVTLTASDVMALRVALADVAKIVATKAGYGFSSGYIPRLRPLEIAILQKAGLRPIDVGLSIKSWETY